MRWVVIVGCLLTFQCLISSIQAQHYQLDFEAYEDGEVPAAAQWSAKWDPNDETQRLLWRVLAGAGQQGSKAYALDTSQAKHSYVSVYSKGVTSEPGPGETIVIKADFKFTTTDQTPLVPNVPVVGLRITASNQWWENEGGAYNFCIIRRSNAAIGVQDPALMGQNGNISGWILNPEIGGSGTSNEVPKAWESNWMTLTVTLLDNGSHYQATMFLSSNGKVLYRSEKPMDTDFPSGSM
ncbi:MAG: hypothetical protein AAF571_08875, partial [Verrucomicrobiota bacterium]